MPSNTGQNPSPRITAFFSFAVILFFIFACFGQVRAECRPQDKPRANAGQDLTVMESETATLDGSATGSNDLAFVWTCNGGTIENAASKTVRFMAPEVAQNTLYVCTLKAENSCGFSYDTVNILVKDKPGEAEIAGQETIFFADPATGCAPLQNVSLTAKIGSNNNRYPEYTYEFYCNGGTDISKTVTLNENSYTAEGLCFYAGAGTYNAVVKIAAEGQPDIEKSATISVENCSNIGETRVNIVKLASNISKGTAYNSSITASPGEEIAFKITVEAVGGTLKEVVLSDTFPKGIGIAKDISIDGRPVSGDLKQGLSLGDIGEGKTLTIAFTAMIDSPDKFAAGKNLLINIAKVKCSNDGCFGEGSAEISVLQDPADTTADTKVITDNETGFGDNPLTDSFVIPAGLSLVLVWVFRNQLIRFEEWADGRKKNYFVYKSEKMLNLKRARLRIKKLKDKWM